MFANLNSKKQAKVYRQALKKSAQILVKETKQQLKKSVHKINTKHTTKSGETYSLSRGIKSTVKKDGLQAKVHIMGDFRLKFFEMGTKPRYLRRKKKAYRGKITPYKFFYKSQRLKEKEVFDSINKNIKDAILKVAKK